MQSFKKLAIIALIFTLIGAGLMYYFTTIRNDDHRVIPDSELIQMEMKNVSKLVVNEAKISQIYNYKNEKSFLGLMSFDKKALILVTADIEILYDLSKLEYAIDENNKTLRILNIPKEEIKISPDIKLYDIQESTFNNFSGSDYNEIQEKVKERFRKQVLSSNIQRNAKERLVSELGKFLIVTNSLGWKLEYKEQVIDNLESLKISIE